MTKPFVFVLMPFDSSFDDVYKLGIKEAANNAGGYCERVDEQIYEERMLDRIYNQINKADVIVADLTGRNPNVFYEIGYAHALDKRVILLTSNAEDIPFDLKHHFHIVYNNSISSLKDNLTTRLNWYFENSDKTQLPNTKQFEIYLKNNKIVDNVVVKIKRRGVLDLKLRFEVQNISATVSSSKVKFGLIVDKKYGLQLIYNKNNNSFEEYNSIKHKDLFLLNGFIEPLLPFCWTNISIDLLSFANISEDVEVPITIKLYSETGFEDINFILSCVNE